MKKFIVIITLFLMTFSLKSQNPFSLLEDTTLLSVSLRYGKMSLSPFHIFLPNAARIRTSGVFPEEVSAHQFSLNFFHHFHQIKMGNWKTGMFATTDFAVVRVRPVAGIFFVRESWFVSSLFGYHVVRDTKGLVKNNFKRYSNNIPIAGISFGYKTRNFESSILVERDWGVGSKGWFFSGYSEYSFWKVFRGGLAFDPIFGLGPNIAYSKGNVRIQNHILLWQYRGQKTRFPDFFAGLDRGYSVQFLYLFR